MMLIRHVESCKQTIDKMQFVGVSTGKAWVNGANLMNTIVVLTNNIVCICPPQVVCVPQAPRALPTPAPQSFQPPAKRCIPPFVWCIVAWVRYTPRSAFSPDFVILGVL